MSAQAAGPVAALRRLGAMGLFAALVLGALLLQAAPMGPLPDAPIPDLAWCVLAFFVLRRPQAAPPRGCARAEHTVARCGRRGDRCEPTETGAGAGGAQQ